MPSGTVAGLTWREAALHDPASSNFAVDHLGIIEGVRKASEDRLQELQEDYWWIQTALEPLRGLMVPIGKEVLESLWREKSTIKVIRNNSSPNSLAPIQLEEASSSNLEASLLAALTSIGIIDERSNGKINVPDIFRVEAGIKRKGGVKPPVRAK